VVASLKIIKKINKKSINKEVYYFIILKNF